MSNKRYWRWFALPVVLAALVGVIGFCIQRENRTCMGVEILSEQRYHTYTNYEYEDLSKRIMQGSEPAAIDVASSTIYISQNITSETNPSDMVGVLKIQGLYNLYFAPDAAFSDLDTAVKEGHRFLLLASSGQDSFMRYDVVFTTLPLLRLEGTTTSVDEDGRDVFSGNLCLWTGYDPDAGNYMVKTSALQWHGRGNATAASPKKSLKLSLKTAKGNNNDVAFLGLGADDDWILNAMWMDDTKIRERLIMDTWNEMQNTTSYQLRMSSGGYVEAVINGQYMGLFGLQRRVDEKYLGLDDQDILCKGKGVMEASTPQEAYEVKYATLGEAQAYETISAHLAFINQSSVAGTQASLNINLENWIDYSLYVQFGNLIDNYLFNNTYFLLRNSEDGKQLYFIPWDTDLSLGIYIQNGRVDYVPATSDRGTNWERIEKGKLLLLYPDLEKKLAERWYELRSTVLSEESLHGRIMRLHTEIESSGALTRDKALWTGRFGGEDSVDGLLSFVSRRLTWLDTYYSH